MTGAICELYHSGFPSFYFQDNLYLEKVLENVGPDP